MELFHQKTQIDFVGNRHKLFAVSGALVAVSLASILFKGFNYGIEFMGGSVIQLTYSTPQSIEQMRSDLAEAGKSEVGVQQFTGTETFSLRMKAEGEGSAQATDELIAALERARPESKFRVDKKDFVGPAVGKHLYRQALLAILLSLAGIVVYVAFRFSNLIWGLAGITALGHDVIVLLGLYSLLGSEMNLVLVAAVLTLAGYSINDTIVIFDRMREKMRLMRKEPLERIINESVNETLSRTFITAFTVFMAVMSLWLVGGSIIRDFAMGMTFGTIIGCYSTIAVASPLVFVFNARPSSAPALAPSGKPEPARTPGNGPTQQRERKRKRN